MSTPVWTHTTYKGGLHETTVTYYIRRIFRKPIKCEHIFCIENNQVTAFLHKHNGELVH